MLIYANDKHTINAVSPFRSVSYTHLDVYKRQVNQAVKAIVIAKGYLAEEGVNITCVPSFVDVDIDDQERTAIRFVIEPNG